ncbi:MAG: nucleotidyltransferase family protein [Candidatus Omnitrophota bacterium]
MKGVILAAGKGTRMKDLTKDKPKPMVETGKRLILEHVFNQVKKAGVKDLLVITGYYATIIEDNFKDGRDFGLNITYMRQETLDGTGNATKLAENFVDGDTFLLTYGDIMSSVENYPHMIKEFNNDPSDALLALTWVEDPYRGAAVYLGENNKIEKIIEKPPKGTSTSNWNNAGIYIFSPVVFDYLRKIKLSPRGEYELPDAITLMMQDKRDVRGFKLDGYWGDLGTPEDVIRMNEILEDLKK